MKYAKIANGAVEQTQPYMQEGFIECSDDVVAGMLYDGVTYSVPLKTQQELLNEAVEHYKSLYLAIISAKLKELDYDSLATVKLWEGDATYGAEATKILTWYKNIITTNYGILTAIEASIKYNASWVDVIPTEEEYITEINAVVF